jgi:hypothetical protein
MKRKFVHTEAFGRMEADVIDLIDAAFTLRHCREILTNLDWESGIRQARLRTALQMSEKLFKEIWDVAGEKFGEIKV